MPFFYVALGVKMGLMLLSQDLEILLMPTRMRRKTFDWPSAPWKGSKLTFTSPIGAGDTFIAGMLYALNCKNEEWDLAKKLSFANQIAGRKVAQEGFSGLGRALENFS
ncbi:pfkB family kinase [Penicillium macrosclerotiorum]|uniref:pfkB family kinase n=1 Tax=Penicillium macrosclerotiorum TaxID=303699 RepID=UPI0025469642|nr:pfkB family kinase [Penicillium macrosclerotiorum]KAJ5676078.1 pfkB family kinase [Penicillium macrosclerotiorum]